MNSPHTDRRAYRLTSIDLLRGLVVVIMAIDHVRDFMMAAAAQDPSADPSVSPALFATRWITHFCAPVFVILSGTSAGLAVGRKSPAELSRFLAVRGAWLLFVEVFVVSTAATLSPFGVPQLGGRVLVIMQVIWAIGASMLVLAALSRIGRPACLVIGLAILSSHNLLDPYWPKTQLLDEQWPLWVALHAQMAHTAGPFLLVFVYPVLAWVGVMLVGFGIAGVFERSPDARNKALFWAGLSMTVAFVVLRAIDAYGDPNHWEQQPGGPIATVIDFLNATKYPPSLDFLLMTLGPAAMFTSFADRLTGFVRDTLVMFGRVPFAFYVAHFYLIHALSILLAVAQGFEAREFLTIFLFYPPGYGVGLVGVYAAWALVIVILYPFCRWVARVKARRTDWWLSYV